MPEWLQQPSLPGGAVAVTALLVQFALALLLGGVVAGVYALARPRPWSEAASFVTTLVLLTVLIAMVTLVIGGSVARAFSLVGALAIVRFRTVVEDTRDTAFVIFAVVVGMGVGAGDVSRLGAGDILLVPLVGIPFVAAAALLLSRVGRGGVTSGPAFALDVRVGLTPEPAERLRDVFARYLAESRLTSTATARQGAALDLRFAVRLRQADDAVAFVGELNRVEGVQNVELREA